MFSRCEKLKVLNPVVTLDAVAVMNHLPRQETTVKVFCHNQTVFCYYPIFLRYWPEEISNQDTHHNISLFILILAVLVPMIQLANHPSTGNFRSSQACTVMAYLVSRLIKQKSYPSMAMAILALRKYEFDIWPSLMPNLGRVSDFTYLCHTTPPVRHSIPYQSAGYKPARIGSPVINIWPETKDFVIEV